MPEVVWNALSKQSSRRLNKIFKLTENRIQMRLIMKEIEHF